MYDMTGDDNPQGRMGGGSGFGNFGDFGINI